MRATAPDSPGRGDRPSLRRRTGWAATGRGRDPDDADRGREEELPMSLIRRRTSPITDRRTIRERLARAATLIGEEPRPTPEHARAVLEERARGCARPRPAAPHLAGARCRDLLAGQRRLRDRTGLSPQDRALDRIDTGSRGARLHRRRHQPPRRDPPHCRPSQALRDGSHRLDRPVLGDRPRRRAQRIRPAGG